MADIEDLQAWDAENPLLMRLPPEKSFFDWFESLGYDPRRDWKKPYLPLESHTRMIKHLFVGTELATSLALGIHGAMIEALRARDPRLEANKRRLGQILMSRPDKLGDELEKLPWFPFDAAGGIVQGPTGVGKSQSLQAYLRHFPQVVEHEANEECGWGKLKQLVYLRVDLPDDAHRRSLFVGILQAIDEALGTDYYDSVAKTARTGTLLLEVLKKLSLHRCGLLILEEAQARNLGPAVLGNEFVVGFLRIMNCGIPLVLVGNPVAFTNILSFSQDQRRLSDIGIFNFGPAASRTTPDWYEDLVPQVWGWTIFNKPDELRISRELCDLLFERTGGIVDVLARYRRECLVAALRRGGDRIEAKDLEVAFSSPAMKPRHDLIAGYVSRDMNLISRFTDQPITYLAEYWNAQDRLEQAVHASREENKGGR